MKGSRRTWLRSLVACISPILMIGLAACGQAGPGGEGQQAAPDGDEPVAELTQRQTVTLDTFYTGYVQIDACPNNFSPLGDTLYCAGATWRGDANFFSAIDYPAEPPPEGFGLDKDWLASAGRGVTFTPQPSRSVNFPPPNAASTPYVDWNTLAAPALAGDHFVSDYSAGTDPSAFPGSDSCVGAANVLDKMNLTFVAVSNNTAYAYFGVQRRDNQGDAGYMWIFNRLPPPSYGIEDTLLGTNDGLGDNCGAAEYPLTFKVSTGDVLFRGHFAPSSEIPLLSVYRVETTITAATVVHEGNKTFNATCDAGGTPCYVILPAKSAINWTVTVDGTTTPLWLENAGYVSGAAANTSIAGLGVTGTGGSKIGSAGLKSLIAENATYKTADGLTWECRDPNGCMGDNLFAEVAVQLSAFLGTNRCGATFYGSAISRSSGTTPSPDMKDLAGPYQFNFGSVTAHVKAQPVCAVSPTTYDFQYKMDSFTDLLGGQNTPTKCTWYVKYGSGSGQIFTKVPTNDPGTNGCAYTTVAATWFNYKNLPATQTGVGGAPNLTTPTLSSGQATIWVEAEDSAGCKATSNEATVYTYPPLGASASMTGSCTNSFTYSGSGSGGSSPTNAYTYGWAFSPGSLTSSTASGSLTSLAAGAYSGVLTVTDGRTDIVCTATSPASANVYSPFDISLAVSPGSLACTAATPNADFLTAALFTATPSGGSTTTPTFTWNAASGCTGATCSVDDATTCGVKTVSVYATDPVCGNSSTKSGTYTKVTTVTATVP